MAPLLEQFPAGCERAAPMHDFQPWLQLDPGLRRGTGGGWRVRVDTLRSQPEPAQTAGAAPAQIAAAAWMIGTNFSAVRLAPPTSAPSTFSTARILAAFSPVTEPP